MKKPSKAIISISTSNTIQVEKYKKDILSMDDLIFDFKEAVNASSFKNENNEDIDFEYNMLSENLFSVKMNNFNGISYKDSFNDAPENRKMLFKAWSKFLSHLTKLGYTIK